MKNLFYQKLVRILFKLFLSILSISSRDITQNFPEGNALVIAPHPDDETLGCGSTIARFVAQGRKVRIIAIYQGSNFPVSKILSPDKIALMRCSELIKGMACLGLKRENIIFFNYPDTSTQENIKEIAYNIAQQIKIFDPGIIFSTHEKDYHPHHNAVAIATKLAIKKISFKGIYYNYVIWYNPFQALNYLLTLKHVKVRTGEYLDLKKSAIKEHRSQLENLTGEKDWKGLPSEFVLRFLKPFEIFFENPSKKDQYKELLKT
jgi:LmbE family N-acetylglucosaminyl deacetylase